MPTLHGDGDGDGDGDDGDGDNDNDDNDDDDDDNDDADVDDADDADDDAEALSTQFHLKRVSNDAVGDAEGETAREEAPWWQATETATWRGEKLASFFALGSARCSSRYCTTRAWFCFTA